MDKCELGCPNEGILEVRLQARSRITSMVSVFVVTGWMCLIERNLTCKFTSNVVVTELDFSRPPQ